MKAIELTLEKEGYTFSANTHPSKSHYKHLMRLGRVYPTTQAQARHFIKTDCSLDCLNADDVELIESDLGRYGFRGEYKPTKSGRWVRLVNDDALRKALARKFDLPIKKKKITLSGGFHNSDPINILVDSADIKYLKDGRLTLADVITKSQEQKLERHFCGMSDCLCGSWIRADIEF